MDSLDQLISQFRHLRSQVPELSADAAMRTVLFLIKNKDKVTSHLKPKKRVIPTIKTDSEPVVVLKQRRRTWSACDDAEPSLGFTRLGPNDDDAERRTSRDFVPDYVPIECGNCGGESCSMEGGCENWDYDYETC